MYLLVCLLSSAPEASTIVCPEAAFDAKELALDRLQRADVILLGTVVSESTPRVSLPPKQNPPVAGEREVTSLAELLEQIEQGKERDSYDNGTWQHVSLEVEKIWKGPALRLISVKNRVVPGQFGSPLRVGDSYLVVATRRDDGELVISTVCGETRREEFMEEQIAWLDKLANDPEQAELEKGP